ncbi:MAG TPA: prephenate dehydrogenase/arogenate dehydrogenase family protein [Phycisphaerae bacterium]|nr:prephenate dehydrogenase/arogenate dehydrogenase family protein [Phycisphaerae bacterium]
MAAIRERSVFERVMIVGVGLLGASLGLALKERGLAKRVVGVGRAASASLGIAKARGAIDEAHTEIHTALLRFGRSILSTSGSIPFTGGPQELVVLCTPLRQFPGALEALRGRVGPHLLVTDVGSTKGEVMGWAKRILGADARWFVGSHPMAGSEKHGPGAARADLYDGAVCLICGGEAEAAALGKIEAMWQAVGMRTLRVDSAVHDRWVATISHLPHAVAFSLMNAAAREPESLQAAANGFLDTTRVASSDVDMWTDIFLTNRAALVAAIDSFTADLSALKAAVVAGDEPAIRAALSNAKKSRDELVARRTPGQRESGSGE